MATIGICRMPRLHGRGGPSPCESETLARRKLASDASCAAAAAFRLQFSTPTARSPSTMQGCLFSILHEFLQGCAKSV